MTMPHQSKAGSETERVEETYTTDLAARFEAKREECCRGAQSHADSGIANGYLAQAAAFAEARDMARADAAGGAGDTRLWATVPRVLPLDMAKALHATVRIRCVPERQEASILNEREVWDALLIAAHAPLIQGGVSSPLGEGEGELTQSEIVKLIVKHWLTAKGTDDETADELSDPEQLAHISPEDYAACVEVAEAVLHRVRAPLAALGTGEGSGGAGFGPGAIEAASRAYYDGMIGREDDQWPHHLGWAGKSEAFKAKVRAHMARALEAALTAQDQAGEAAR